MGADQLRKLDRRARLVGGGPATCRWLFSREGYAPECKNLAEAMGTVRLVTFDQMVGDQVRVK